MFVYFPSRFMPSYLIKVLFPSQKWKGGTLWRHTGPSDEQHAEAITERMERGGIDKARPSNLRKTTKHKEGVRLFHRHSYRLNVAGFCGLKTWGTPLSIGFLQFYKIKFFPCTTSQSNERKCYEKIRLHSNLAHILTVNFMNKKIV